MSGKKKEVEKEEYDMSKELKKTFIPIIFGVIAGILSYVVTGNMRQRDAFTIVILVFLIYAQKFVLPKVGINLENKDWLGIAFLTFSSWYISWTMLLNQ